MNRHLTAFLASAAITQGAASGSFFGGRALPILRQRCYECHSPPSKIKGGLPLDSKSGWRTGGDHGPAIAPGNTSKSLLIEAVSCTNPDMETPPKGKLAASEIELLEKRVTMGAPDPRSGAVTEASSIDIEAGKQSWAFQPVRESQPPAVQNTNWPVNDVDRFILAKQESAGLTPAPDADARTRLRRVYLDLTGLPPTPEEIATWSSAIAFAAVVSPAARPIFGPSAVMLSLRFFHQR